MGINGLLPALKPISKQVHVRQYAGQRVAVDGYSWLHKGAYCCARELCEGVWTDKFVTYFLSRINMLRTHEIEPVVVFDGGRLPIKGDEEDSRHRARAEARAKAAAHLAAGNIAAAVECYQRCVDITPAMAKQVIEELKSQNVTFVVAPYEADAQMAYLARSGRVQLVVTEDSDLLAYGCPRVLYKLDKTGTGEEVSLEDLPNCSGLPLAGWTSDQFLQLCVMAGCDFLAPLPGIGLKKAHGVLRKYRSFTKVVKMLRFNGTKVPPDYEAKFQLALWAFRHARVYCDTQKALVHLAPLPGGGIGAADVDVPAAVTQLEQQQQEQRLDFLGPVLPPDVAQGIAEGELDPSTHKPYDLAVIYAGCHRPPAHLAAHLAQLRPAADPGAAEAPYPSSQAVSGFSGGAAAAGKPRVGLSKRHAGQSGGSNKCLSGAPAAGSDGARQPAAGNGKRRTSLGIAKYFQTSAAAAGKGSQATALTTPAAAVSKPTADAAAAPVAAQGIQHSIAKAITMLGQQLHQCNQQQQAEKQQLLQQLAAEQQQAAEHADHDQAGGDCAFSLPSPKRRRRSGPAAAPAAAAAGPDLGDDGAILVQGANASEAMQQVHSSMDFSMPSNGSLRLSGHTDSPAGAGSMSLEGLGGASCLADGSSSGADLGPSQQGTGLFSSDPSFLCGSLQGVGASQPSGGQGQGRGAAVSALSALFTLSGGQNSSQGIGRATWGSSQPLFGSPAGSPELQDVWRLQTGGQPGGFFSQPADLNSSGLLGGGSDAGGSLDGCGSSSGLSLGPLCSSGGGAAAVWDSTTSVSLGEAAEQDLNPDAGFAAAAACAGSINTSRRLQQCLRAGLSRPQRQQQQQQQMPEWQEPEQQQARATEPGRSSFFSQQQQPSTVRRHSRFREQLLKDADVIPVAADNPEDLAVGQDQELRRQQLQQAAPLQQRAGLHAPTSGQQADAAMRPSTQRQQHCVGPQVSDSPEPSSSSVSNDENSEAAADAAGLEHLGITHVRRYAKLAHKAVKHVVKQQQHNPLAPNLGLLNTQLQSQPLSAMPQLQQTQQEQLKGITTGIRQDGGAAAGPDRMRLKLGLSRGPTRSNRKGMKHKGPGVDTGSFAAKLAELKYDASMFVPLEQPGQEEEDAAAGAAPQQPAAVAAARRPFKAPWVPAAAGGRGRSGDDGDADDVQIVEPATTATAVTRPKAAASVQPGGFGNFAKFALR